MESDAKETRSSLGVNARELEEKCHAAVEFATEAEIAQRQTERLANELRVSEEQYRLLVEATSAVVWVSDCDGRFVAPQAAWEAFTGQTCQEYEGFGWTAAIHQDDRQAFLQGWRQAVEERKLFFARGRLWHAPTQHYRYFQASAVPMTNADGADREWVGSIVDIDGEQRARLALEESEIRLHSTLDAVSAGAWDWDIATGQVYFNSSWLKSLGYDRDSASANLRFWESLIHPDDLPYVQQARQDHLDGKSEFFECEKRLRKSTGEYQWNLVRGKVVQRDAAGQPTRMLGTEIDLTERIEAARALRESEKRLRAYALLLKRSNEDLEQFAYVASHDLQEPLRAVSGYCEYLQLEYGDKLDDTAKQYIRHAIEGAERMQTLIADLLDYSRVNRKGQVPEQVDSASTLRKALDRLSVAIKESGADLHYGDLPVITADARQFEQLFQNLIGNAIKYRRDATPEIRITAKFDEAADEWLFAVQDNGIGIEPEFHQQIFTIFQRLHTRDQYAGTGIGLAVCKRIVERHGGRIWVESKTGQGSSFWFSIPRVPPDTTTGGKDDIQALLAVEPVAQLLADSRERHNSR